MRFFILDYSQTVNILFYSPSFIGRDFSSASILGHWCWQGIHSNCKERKQNPSISDLPASLDAAAHRLPALPSQRHVLAPAHTSKPRSCPRPTGKTSALMHICHVLHCAQKACAQHAVKAQHVGCHCGLFFPFFFFFSLFFFEQCSGVLGFWPGRAQALDVLAADERVLEHGAVQVGAVEEGPRDHRVRELHLGETHHCSTLKFRHACRTACSQQGSAHGA